MSEPVDLQEIEDVLRWAAERPTEMMTSDRLDTAIAELAKLKAMPWLAFPCICVDEQRHYRRVMLIDRHFFEPEDECICGAKRGGE